MAMKSEVQVRAVPSQVILGILVIGMGLLFLLDNLDVFDFPFVGEKSPQSWGGCVLDMRTASIQGEAVLNVFVVWGGMTIKCPPAGLSSCMARL
jgi:hypothetical protein